MTAQEIRIGNYIASGANKRDEETWIIGKVVSISSLQSEFEQIEVETDEEFDWFFKDNYFGIPITEKWLLKFGFEKQMAWTYRIHLSGNNYLVYYLGEKGWSINNKVYSDFTCQYVHQLQNLYFAITGKELTINQPK